MGGIMWLVDGVMWLVGGVCDWWVGVCDCGWVYVTGEWVECPHTHGLFIFDFIVLIFFFSLCTDFGQMFSNIGVYEVQKSASVAFTNFGTAHV